jgi:hypothetical protein
MVKRLFFRPRRIKARTPKRRGPRASRSATRSWFQVSQKSPCSEVQDHGKDHPAHADPTNMGFSASSCRVTPPFGPCGPVFNGSQCRKKMSRSDAYFAFASKRKSQNIRAAPVGTPALPRPTPGRASASPDKLRVAGNRHTLVQTDATLRPTGNVTYRCSGTSGPSRACLSLISVHRFDGNQPVASIARHSIRRAYLKLHQKLP